MTDKFVNILTDLGFEKGEGEVYEKMLTSETDENCPFFKIKFYNSVDSAVISVDSFSWKDADMKKLLFKVFHDIVILRAAFEKTSIENTYTSLGIMNMLNTTYQELNEIWNKMY